MRLAPLLLAATFALPLSAARPAEEALSFVPPDAASVGVVKVHALRESALTARLFSETDKMTCDGDAQRFLEETRLNLKEDVDVVVFAGSPKSSGEKGGSGLVAFEGRFDAERLAAAAVARGAVKTGDYYLLPDKREGKNEGAVAFVSNHLIVAGTEEAVAQALARARSRAPGFASGAGLGRHLARVDADATAWVLVDTNRFPQMKAAAGKVQVHGEVNGQAIPNLFGVAKNLSLLTLQATVNGEAVKFAATGLVDDAETRELLEDTLRGALAAWRLAVQDKNPDMVSVLRKFKVSSDRDGVSLQGTLPGAAVRAMLETKTAHKHKQAETD